MMKRQFVFALLLALASFGFAGLAGAQETTTGSITGAVVDTQGAPVPGATITIMSAQGNKTLVTDGRGRFFAPFLTPGKYSIRTELTGFSPVEQKNIDVRLGGRLDLTMTLKVGGLEEVVEVVGTAPVVDTSSTTVGGVLDSDMLQRLPVGRNFTETLYLLPGVSDSSYAGRANPSIGGASGLENNYIIDGVNATNAGFGAFGSFSRRFASLGSGVTSDFIKETQVKTGGFEAEYGQASGGVVNVVTKSGTNAFHGAVFGYWRPASLEGTWKRLDTVNGTTHIESEDQSDFGVSVGGPILKDRMFFFGTFNPQFQTRTMTAPPDFPLESLGSVDRKRRTYSYAAKLTWQLSSNHRVDFSAFGDPSKGEMGPQQSSALRGADTAAFSELNYGGHNQSIKYDGIVNANWLVELTAGHAGNKFFTVPSVDTWAVTDATVVPNLRSGGVGFYEKDKANNYQFTLKSTNIFNAGGNHQVRYGVSYEDIDYLQGTGRTGPTITLANGQQTAAGASVQIRRDASLPGGVFYRVTRSDLTAGRQTYQKYLSFFLQDTWTIGKKLTLRPGIRYDKQKLEGPGSGEGELPYCYPGAPGPIVDGIPTGPPWRPSQAGEGPSIPCTRTFDNNWGPRLGATYDIRGDGRSKLFASFGRFYVKIPNDMAARAMAADASVTRGDYYDAALTQPIPTGVLAGGTTTHLTIPGNFPAIFDLNVKSTYSQEFVGGFEIEPAQGVNLGLRYIRRNIPRVMEDVAPAQMLLYSILGVEYFITNVTNDTPTYDPAAFDHPEWGPQARFEDPSHKYQAIEFTGSKSFSNNWSLLASYRYSKLEGNYEGFFRSDNGQADPGITSLFDFPTSDPSYTGPEGQALGYLGDIRFQGTTLGQGKLPNDRPHQLKLYTNYTWGKLNAGLGLNVGSGRSLTALAANPGYTNSGEIPMTLRGEGFQTQDGFLKKTSTETYIDLHLDYTLSFGSKSQRVVLLADAFNLFDTQDPLDYDNFYELGFGDLNPDFGSPKPGGGNFSSYHAPRQIRLGARFEW